MGMSSARQDTEVMAEINITPFTDVLLVLLIIFMILAALAAPPGFQKQLPKKNNQPQNITQKELKHQIDVRVTAKNKIYIDGKLVPSENLYDSFVTTVNFHKAHEAQGYTQHVSLIADQDANYNTIIKILDAARAAGDDDVGFVTE
jgi:biopolymer transport protein ExbD